MAGAASTAEVAAPRRAAFLGSSRTKALSELARNP